MGLGKTLAELEGIHADELLGWRAFYELEPWGCAVEDQRAEYALQMQWMIHAKKNAKYTPFLDRDPAPAPPPPSDEEELEAKVREVFAGFHVIRQDANGQPLTPE